MPANHPLSRVISSTPVSHTLVHYITVLTIIALSLLLQGEPQDLAETLWDDQDRPLTEGCAAVVTDERA